MPVKKIARLPESGGAAQPPRSRAFFLELLLNMLIFALCAVVALQVFVEGKLISDDSAAYTRLTIDAESLAEEFKVSDGQLSSLSLPDREGVVEGDGTLTFYYNRNLEPAGPEDAVYSIKLVQTSKPGDLVNTVAVSGQRGDQEFLSFEVKLFKPAEGR